MKPQSASYHDLVITVYYDNIQPCSSVCATNSLRYTSCSLVAPGSIASSSSSSLISLDTDEELAAVRSGWVYQCGLVYVLCVVL